MAGAFAASKGGYGYRRVKAMLRTGVSEKVIRGIMAEDGPTVHVPERRGYGSYGGETTPAPDNLADRDFMYFVKLRWTCSALNLDTVGVQLEHRRRLVPCFVVCLVYFMRECLFR